MRALLFIGANPQSSPKEVGIALGQPSSTVSRQLRDLGEGDHVTKDGFGLIEDVPDALDARMKRYRLTITGRALLNAMLQELRGAPR